jgi:hypothetical protein
VVSTLEQLPVLEPTLVLMFELMFALMFVLELVLELELVRVLALITLPGRRGGVRDGGATDARLLCTSAPDGADQLAAAARRSISVDDGGGSAGGESGEVAMMDFSGARAPTVDRRCSNTDWGRAGTGLSGAFSGVWRHRCGGRVHG